MKVKPIQKTETVGYTLELNKEEALFLYDFISGSIAHSRKGHAKDLRAALLKAGVLPTSDVKDIRLGSNIDFLEQG